MSRKCVAVQGLSWRYLENLNVFRIVSGMKIDEFSGLIPETLPISYQDILGRRDEDPIPSICKRQNCYDSICSAQ